MEIAGGGYGYCLIVDNNEDALHFCRAKRKTGHTICAIYNTGTMVLALNLNSSMIGEKSLKAISWLYDAADSFNTISAEDSFLFLIIGYL